MNKNLKQAFFSALLVWAVAFPVLATAAARGDEAHSAVGTRTIAWRPTRS